MGNHAITCTNCDKPVSPELLNSPDLIRCSQCGTRMLVAAFPALLRAPQRPSPGDRIFADGEASCFFHSTRRAEVPCDGCGRFLCSLCNIQLGTQHLCPSCVEAGTKPTSSRKLQLDSKRPMYDGVALVLAIIPTIITPLIALYLAVRHWSAPGSVIGRSRWKWILAIIISLAQLAMWALYFLGKYF